MYSFPWQEETEDVVPATCLAGQGATRRTLDPPGERRVNGQRALGDPSITAAKQAFRGRREPSQQARCASARPRCGALISCCSSIRRCTVCLLFTLISTGVRPSGSAAADSRLAKVGVVHFRIAARWDRSAARSDMSVLNPAGFRRFRLRRRRSRSMRALRRLISEAPTPTVQSDLKSIAARLS